MTRQNAIRISGLTKRYGGRRALDDVSLAVEAGEVVALLGPSGAGKTTLFRCLTRLVEHDGGEMVVAGHAMHRLSGRALARARREIGLVFQQYNLVRRRSALDNAVAGRLADIPLWRLVTRFYPGSSRRDAEAALDRVGLLTRARSRADQLSGGQQQRVAIARALVQRARVLLADEPVASLDPEAAANVLALMRDIAKEDRIAVLCSLHQRDLAERFADRLVLMREGRIVTGRDGP